jgi:hypothetical protein
MNRKMFIVTELKCITNEAPRCNILGMFETEKEAQDHAYKTWFFQEWDVDALERVRTPENSELIDALLSGQFMEGNIEDLFQDDIHFGTRYIIQEKIVYSVVKLYVPDDYRLRNEPSLDFMATCQSAEEAWDQAYQLQYQDILDNLKDNITESDGPIADALNNGEPPPPYQPGYWEEVSNLRTAQATAQARAFFYVIEI